MTGQPPRRTNTNAAPAPDEPANLHELATFPPGHASRQTLEIALSDQAPEQRTHWRNLATEYDVLRDSLQNASALPPALQARLLAVPLDVPSGVPETKGASRIRRMLHEPMGWRHVAALLVVTLCLGFAYQWWSTRNRVTWPLPLSVDQIARVTDLATRQQSALPPPAPSTRPADTVAFNTQFADKHLPFTPVLLTPSRSGVDFVDAGITSLGNAPALYTRWRSEGQILTLYQAAPSSLGLPARFQPTSHPCEAAPDANIEIWPGNDGNCTWILLRSASQNNFFFY